MYCIIGFVFAAFVKPVRKKSKKLSGPICFSLNEIGKNFDVEFQSCIQI